MYMQALEFLEDERDSWRPYEALAALSDEQLERATAEDSAAHGWSGRDLISHMVAWREYLLSVARELALNEHSETQRLLDAEWDAVGADAVNERLAVPWRTLPMVEVRHRLDNVPGELRGYLTVVPETRWIKNADVQRAFVETTLEHDEEHRADLEHILQEAAGGEPAAASEQSAGQ
jgi:hypothetical protein